MYKKDNSIYNELYYKELIGKKILFTHIEKTVSNQSWYQEKKAYRPQIVAYTFAKLVYSAEQVRKKINYKEIWDLQDVPSAFNFDIENIAKIVFDCINDEKRETTHIETYCKKETCWTVVKKVEYHVSDELSEILVGINN